MWNRHHHQTLSMRKKSMKWRKSESIERRDRELNIWYIGEVMGMSMTNELQKQDCLMKKEQLKTIG